MSFVVHDPRGASQAATFAAAPAPAKLEGLTIGVLDNSKEQAAVLLGRAAALLERDGLRPRFFRKPVFSRPLSPELLEELRVCDLVITGLGG